MKFSPVEGQSLTVIPGMLDSGCVIFVQDAYVGSGCVCATQDTEVYLGSGPPSGNSLTSCVFFSLSMIFPLCFFLPLPKADCLPLIAQEERSLTRGSIK